MTALRPTAVAPAVRLGHAHRSMIPVFPGTNCEYDTARAFRRAGGDPHVLVLKNLTPADVAESCDALVKALDEVSDPHAAGRLLRRRRAGRQRQVHHRFLPRRLLWRTLSTVCSTSATVWLWASATASRRSSNWAWSPTARSVPSLTDDPTLTFNTVGRHQSMLVRTRVASTKSPWLSECSVNDEHLIASQPRRGPLCLQRRPCCKQLIDNGQVATQYVDLNCLPTMDLRYNPNGSVLAIEGITSPDGRVLGKMGHSERSGEKLYKNVARRQVSADL